MSAHCSRRSSHASSDNRPRTAHACREIPGGPALQRVDDRLGGHHGAGGRFASPGFASTRPPVAWAGGLGFQAFASGAGPSLGENAGVAWVLAGRGGLRFGVVGCRGRALSSVGPRRQSGTCREVKRRWFPLMLDLASRRLTSRQNPDRASPARPRREPTPWGSGVSCARAGSCPVARSRSMRKNLALPFWAAVFFSTSSTPGSAPECPESPIFFFSGKGWIRGFCRWWRLVWRSTGVVGACDGRVDGVAGQMASGVWPKTVQDFPSGCGRAARSCAVREHRVEPIGAMQNSTAGTTGAPTSARIEDRVGTGSRRCRILSDRARPACGILPRWSDQGDAGSFRTERGRATRRDSARAQLAPDPQGVGSLLGRAGEARSGFCREVKRRDAGSSMSGSRRRLSSRQVPDCLRGPAEEGTRPRHPTTPNLSPPRRASTPQAPAIPPREGPRRRRDLEAPAVPANATGGQGG